jgi:hypothetical protein
MGFKTKTTKKCGFTSFAVVDSTERATSHRSQIIHNWFNFKPACPDAQSTAEVMRWWTVMFLRWGSSLSGPSDISFERGGKPTEASVGVKSSSA